MAALTSGPITAAATRGSLETLGGRGVIAAIQIEIAQVGMRGPVVGPGLHGRQKIVRRAVELPPRAVAPGRLGPTAARAMALRIRTRRDASPAAASRALFTSGVSDRPTPRPRWNGPAARRRRASPAGPGPCPILAAAEQPQQRGLVDDVAGPLLVRRASRAAVSIVACGRRRSIQPAAARRPGSRAATTCAPTGRPRRRLVGMTQIAGVGRLEGRRRGRRGRAHRMVGPPHGRRIASSACGRRCTGSPGRRPCDGCAGRPPGSAGHGRACRPGSSPAPRTASARWACGNGCNRACRS